MKNVRQQIEQHLKSEEVFFEVFARWFWISVLIGLAGGLVGSAFYQSVFLAAAINSARPFLIYFLPLGGLAIAWLYKFTRTEGESTNDIIDSILLGNRVPLALTPTIFISTVITHLLGGSAGREGAALQIGGSIGCNIGRLVKLDEKEERIAILSGMSAVFSALFGTPITAIVFALEVCSVGIIHYSGLVPCGISALVAFGLTKLFGIAPTAFTLPAFTHGAFPLICVCILSAFCAVLSTLFCRVMHLFSHLSAKHLPDPYLRAFTGGLLIIALTLLCGNRDYNGGGVNVIVRAIEQGSARPWDFAFKILFTAITLSAGFKGGEIVPSFFIGATFGCVLGPLLGLPAGFAAAVGLISFFCGAVNCPLASTILSIELFGSEHLIYFASACFISYMLSGYTSLYEEQKIIYSKLKAEFINRKAE